MIIARHWNRLSRRTHFAFISFSRSRSPARDVIHATSHLRSLWRHQIRHGDVIVEKHSDVSLRRSDARLRPDNRFWTCRMQDIHLTHANAIHRRSVLGELLRQSHSEGVHPARERAHRRREWRHCAGVREVRGGRAGGRLGGTATVLDKHRSAYTQTCPCTVNNAVSMCFNFSCISGASKIEYFDLGSDTRADLLSSNVMHPTSLTFDSRSKTLYWIDKG